MSQVGVTGGATDASRDEGERQRTNRDHDPEARGMSIHRKVKTWRHWPSFFGGNFGHTVRSQENSQHQANDRPKYRFAQVALAHGNLLATIRGNPSLV